MGSVFFYDKTEEMEYVESEEMESELFHETEKMENELFHETEEMENELFYGEDFFNLTDVELKDRNRGRIYCNFRCCQECFEKFVKKYKFKDRRIICALYDEDEHCTIDDAERYDTYCTPIEYRYYRYWTCDSCGEEGLCPSCDVVEIMYMDKKLPLEIQAEIKSLEIYWQIMYGPRSQAYRNAKNNFENICQQWKGD
jgi:hypothetical protein